MPDDHSKVAPLLPIPNRTVKRLCADDSADSRVKVGHRQALIANPPALERDWGIVLCGKPFEQSSVADEVALANQGAGADKILQQMD